MQRRALLSSLTVVGAVTVAGCSSDSGGGNSGDTTSSAEHPAVSATKSYYSAVYDGDEVNVEEANRYVFEDSTSYIYDPEGYEEAEVTDTEYRMVSPEEVVGSDVLSCRQDRAYDSADDAEDALQSEIQAVNADDGVFVYVDLQRNDIRHEILYYGLKTEGDWKINAAYGCNHYG